MVGIMVEFRPILTLSKKNQLISSQKPKVISDFCLFFDVFDDFYGF